MIAAASDFFFFAKLALEAIQLDRSKKKPKIYWETLREVMVIYWRVSSAAWKYLFKKVEVKSAKENWIKEPKIKLNIAMKIFT